jgi:hypothetical protein
MESERRNSQANGEKRSVRTLSMRWRIVKVGETTAVEARWVAGENMQMKDRTDVSVFTTKAHRSGEGLKILDGYAPENPERGANADGEINADE